MKRGGLYTIGILLVVLGIFIGRISVGHEQKRDIADLTPFWDAWNLLQEKYPFDDRAPTSQEKIQSAISGLVASYGDPYMQYFSQDSLRNFQQDISGEFFGIGAELGIRDEVLTVIAPHKDSPAERAGLKAQDIIVKIDGDDAFDMSIDEAVARIRGKQGTEVVLTIARPGQKDFITIPIIRDIVSVPSLGVTYLQDVPIISLYSFDKQVGELFAQEIQKIDFNKNHRLVIDLRNNPGGYLENAVAIASMILPDGEVIVSEKPGIDGKEFTEHRSLGLPGIPQNVTIAVLVDGGSASAAEILAGALQDAKRATIIGSQTFGKGSVQELVEMPDHSGIKVTVAQWYTPKGRSITDTGITPDIVVSDLDLLDQKHDRALDRALSFLKNNT